MLTTNKQMIERINYYTSKNESCGKHGHIYDKKIHQLYPANCKQFSCGKCRQIEIHKLMKKVVKTARKYDLTRHLVITVPGESYRNRIDADGSFYDFNNKFNEFKTLIQQHFFSTKTYVMWENENGELQKRLQFVPWGDFHYIGFRRSQKNGYCHLHGLIGSYIPYNVLKKFADQVGFGDVNISFVNIRRIHNYLSKYWYKDHEWYIPKGLKHLTKSQSVHWVTTNIKGDVKRWFMITHDNSLGLSFLDTMDAEVQALSGGYPLPLAFILSEFSSKYRRNET